MVVETIKGKILPVTVVAELEFDSVSPPPDKIEEEEDRLTTLQNPHIQAKATQNLK